MKMVKAKGAVLCIDAFRSSLSRRNYVFSRDLDQIRRSFEKVFRAARLWRRAVAGDEFLRYDGEVKIVKDEELLKKVRSAMPQIMDLYDKNGWEMGMFYLENGHVLYVNVHMPYYYFNLTDPDGNTLEITENYKSGQRNGSM